MGITDRGGEVERERLRPIAAPQLSSVAVSGGQGVIHRRWALGRPGGLPESQSACLWPWGEQQLLLAAAGCWRTCDVRWTMAMNQRLWCVCCVVCVVCFGVRVCAVCA